jgi:hypothetical protein
MAEKASVLICAALNMDRMNFPCWTEKCPVLYAAMGTEDVMNAVIFTAP